MNSQVMTTHQNVPIRVHTPMGDIEIYRRQGRKIEIRLPEGIEAFQDGRRPLKHEYVRTNDKGEPVPAYTAIMPVTDENGALSRVAVHKELVIGASHE